MSTTEMGSLIRGLPWKPTSALFENRPHAVSAASPRRFVLSLTISTRRFACELGRASAAGGRAGRAGHTGCDRVGAGPGQVFGGEVRRQDLDHRIVLDPDLDHVERPAVAG